MKQVKGLGGWIRSAIWLELIIPDIFLEKHSALQMQNIGS